MTCRATSATPIRERSERDDQTPPAIDVLRRRDAGLEINKLADGLYRTTVGTLFEHQEICRTNDLEALVRQANVMAGCRSFDDVVRLFGCCGRSNAPSLRLKKEPPEGGPRGMRKRVSGYNKWRSRR